MGLKYLEDPFKKVAYSFRIEEKLLEEIKLYAKATDKKLPETFNYLLKESMKGVNVTNTYLKEYEGIIINISFMSWSYDLDTGFTTFNRGDTNYLGYVEEDYYKYNEDGLTYEVKQIPNNLDVWHKDKGYYSNNPNLEHEGVGLVIVPELVLSDSFRIGQTGITNCLKFIYFTVNQKGDITARNISYKDCFRRLKAVGNNEVFQKFKTIDSKIYNFSLTYMTDIFYDQNPYSEMTEEEHHEIKKYDLYKRLTGLAKKYNDGNIINIEDIPPIVENMNDEVKEELETNEDSSKDEIISKLQEENKALKEQHKKEKEELKAKIEKEARKIFEDLLKENKIVLDDMKK